jgi:hypothetical protein
MAGEFNKILKADVTTQRIEPAQPKSKSAFATSLGKDSVTNTVAGPTVTNQVNSPSAK